ncbi:MAG: acyl--CoA ligase [Candidatus Lokiarchaeota archaeon]|nr:acyl--CoA ligase [Candidatus Lokiarchaeota archaeon]
MREPEKNQECKALYAGMLPRLADYVDLHASQRPNGVALIEYNTDTKVSWKDFYMSIKAFAAKLLDMGIKKGDVVATTLVLLKEHVYLMYACYRIGAIIAPLDPRLKEKEVDYCFEKMRPKAYFFLGRVEVKKEGRTEVNDFRPMVASLMDKHGDTCKHWIQFDFLPHLIIDGATSVRDFAADVKRCFMQSIMTGSVRDAAAAVGKRDPCLLVFTTGSTGMPKPALLCHENIIIQNIGLKVAFDISDKDVMCVNLPPSHVGCVTEQLATTIFVGGTCVILHIFDAEKTLDAIERYKITAFGQIPSLFAMQWRLPSYARYDLSSLRFALYGGQAVSREFLDRLAKMAPKFGSGLGLTETAGFVTYTPLDGTVDDIASSIGYDSPLCPISIREQMKPDGTAGDPRPAGEVGEITFSGPQVFLGYLNDEENTRKTVSSDGFCYTGDLGFYDEKGLHFAGRSKFVIKPKGYQVYPGEIEDLIAEKLADKVELVAVVGVPHEVFTEGVMAFVEKKASADLTFSEIEKVCKEMAAYKRPAHVVILNEGEIPLNRVNKTDYMVLRKQAQGIAEHLREQGKWDAS